MSFELQLDLFDFEDSSPSMSLPSLAELKTPQPEVIIVPEVIATPETPISRRNYRIGMEDILYPHGAKRKIAANIAAIKLLKELESSGKEGDTPVSEIDFRPTSIPSRTEHVKLRLNPGRPLSKPKYSSMTDSV